MPTHTALRNAAIVCLSHTASSKTVHSRAMVTIVTTGNHMLEVEPIGQHGSSSGQNGCGFSFCCYRMTPCYSRSTVSTHTHTYNRLTALCPGLPEWAGTRKVKPIWILLEQETASGSGISWAVCKSAPRSRQITTPAPHHSVFTGRMPFLLPNQQHQST